MEMVARKTRGRPRLADNEQGAGSVQSLERALALLSVLAGADQATLTELSQKTGMPPSSAHRLLMTLQASRFVAFNDSTSEWCIGVEAFRTGASFLRRSRLTEMARDMMHDLVDQTGETANLAVPDGGEVVFISQVETQQPIRAYFGHGARAHMHASGIGKALLAALARSDAERRLQRTGLPQFTPNTLISSDALFAELKLTRERGWAVDDEERNLGMRCVASAIYNAHGEPVGGISISGPSTRLDRKAIDTFGPLVKRAAAMITGRIGGSSAAVPS